MELQWPLVLFTTFVAWSSGTVAVLCAYTLAKKDCDNRTRFMGLLVGLVLMAIGGIAVFFHLEHWERIFNGFGHLTSGITQELICIVLVVVFCFVYFVLMRRADEDSKNIVPPAVSVIGIILGVVTTCITGHSYMLASRPAWDTAFQILSLVGGGAAMGTATVAIIVTACANNPKLAFLDRFVGEGVSYAAPEGKSKFYAVFNISGQSLNLVLVITYLIAMIVNSGEFTSIAYWFDPTSPTREIVDATTISPFEGTTLYVTIAAIACAALGIVAAIVGAKRGKWRLWGGIAVALAFASAICLRVVFYFMSESVYPFF